MFYERDLGITSAWNDTPRVGNPVRSDLVVQYIVFTREQKNAGVLVKQAPALLDSHLNEIITPMRTRLHYTSNTTEGVILARDIALYAVAFRTTNRGYKLSRTLIQPILRLPNESGLLSNFQWGRGRPSSDHHIRQPVVGDMPGSRSRTIHSDRNRSRVGHDQRIHVH